MISREFVDRDIGNSGKNNGSSSTRRPKFISFSVNNRSGHFEQLIIMLEMIDDIFNK